MDITLKDLLLLVRRSTKIVDDLMITNAPRILDDVFLTTDEVMTKLHISRRTLQNYRDDGIIPFVTIGGNILYPASKLNKLLEKNYYKAEAKE